MNNRLIRTPEGIRDIYGNEYLRKNKIEEQIMDMALRYGYQGISTPTFEYFDVFSKEVGTTPSKELFKFFDKENNTLVLRPDFTPSISRCASIYFKNEENPLRFLYRGNVYNNSSDHQGKLKEMTQVGIELLGDESINADAEVITFVVETLLSLGLKDFQITIGESEYFKGICEKEGIGEDDELELRECVSNKNIFKARTLLSDLNLSKEASERIMKVSSLFGGTDVLNLAKENAGNQRSLAAIERLYDLYAVLEMYGVSDYISFDLSMLSKYHYYTGITFQAFAYGVGEPVCKGGRYDNLLAKFGKDFPAIGAVIVTDVLLNALRAQNAEKTLQIRTDVLIYKDEDLKAAIDFAKSHRDAGNSIEMMRYKDGISVTDYLVRGAYKIEGTVYITEKGKVVLYNE